MATPTKKCEKCGKDAIPRERFCIYHRERLMDEMNKSGYLEQVPKRPYLTEDCDDPNPRLDNLEGMA